MDAIRQNVYAGTSPFGDFPDVMDSYKLVANEQEAEERELAAWEAEGER